MEESEVDEWFNEQKEQLEEHFFAQAEKDPVGAKEKFDAAYKKLVSDYQKKMEEIYDQHMRSMKLHAPIDRVKSRIDLFFANIKQWYADRQMEVKKWMFDQKIKRILKDKRNL